MTRNSEGSLFQALAHPSRRAILTYLRDKDFARAGDIAEALAIGRSTLSSHLRILTEAGLTASKIAQDVVSQVLGTRIPVARDAAETGAVDVPLHERS